jgi:hypothetical protein
MTQSFPDHTTKNIKEEPLYLEPPMILLRTVNSEYNKLLCMLLFVI